MAVTLNASTTTGLVQSADTSGVIELQSNGTTKATVNSSGLAIGQYNPSTSLITRGTAVSASSTSVDFTSIPSWVKRITVMLNEVSTNGTSGTVIQIGAGSVTTSGYLSTGAGVSGAGAGVNNYTNGFGMRNDDASYVLSGHMVITNISGNIWISSHTGKISTAVGVFGGGSVTLGGVLDRVRFTTGNGTDTFDAGSINILYE